MITFIEANDLHPTVDRVFDLADAREAFEALDAGDVNGKMVLVNR
jgi:D-arabinose 1-dehydrogenase-like Zn-dependent alcohol dehydrogenase